MTRWLERLLGETQSQLLHLLRRSHRTMTGLADALGLTDTAVRTHIAALGRDGIVEQAGRQRDTGGKPARLYALTSDAEELFPKAYARVLGALVAEIDRRDGRSHVVDLLRTLGGQMAAAVQVPTDVEGRVAVAAAVLRSLGSDVEVTSTAQGWRLQAYGCPLSAVTATHPQVCALAKALVEGITEQPVTECCEHTARPQCGFLIGEQSRPEKRASRRSQPPRA